MINYRIALPLKCSLINFLKAREKFHGKEVLGAEGVKAKLSSRGYWSSREKFELSELSLRLKKKTSVNSLDFMAIRPR